VATVDKRTELRLMIAAVDAMAVEMKKKLRAKARDGYSGGLDRGYRDVVAKNLMEHAERLTGYCLHCEVMDGEHDHEEEARQAIDVANLAMMLWAIEQPGFGAASDVRADAK
jgi:hypothetical protein